MTAQLENSNQPASVTTASTREGSRLKLKLAITVVFVAAALAAAATPSDAQAVTNYGCKTQVWAAMEYLVCTTGDWGAGYDVTSGGWFWYESEISTRSSFLTPWVRVSRRLEWYWIVNGVNYGRYYCSVYHYDWGSTTACS
jgi:hypothetical protein